MKKEELFQKLGEIDEESIVKARTYRRKKKNLRMKMTAAAACVALVVGTLVGVSIGRNVQEGGNHGMVSGVISVQAAYPEADAPGMSIQDYIYSEAHGRWWRESRDKAMVSQAYQAELQDYNQKLMAQLLVSEKENTICSPLNTYFAFAMLAEVSDGNTRQQILEMLGASDIESLRSRVSALWESNYANTPALQSNLANSLWLAQDVNYVDNTLNQLAQTYHASAFRGVMGSPEMDQALRNWTNDNTGNLLTEYTQEMHMKPETVLEILSTIYYKAMWTDEFRHQDTVPEIFHGLSGDTTVDMMKKADTLSIYKADHFSALKLSLNDSGYMYFLLPEENADVNSLLSDPQMMKVFVEETPWSVPMVHLSVPKFKVSGKIDLLDAISSMGIVDALDPELANFTPLTTERDSLYLSKAEHAALLEIDEQGVTGAAYTELAVTEGGMMVTEEMDFIIDRPFLFAVTGPDGSILFTGVVRNIE